jgi:site-specific DNA-cytosine methylase
MMGQSADGDPAEGRSGEALHDLRDEAGAEALRRSPGGPYAVPGAKDVRAVVRELADRGAAGDVPLAGSTATGTEVRGLRDDGAVARTPPGPRPDEQRAGESGDAVRVVSPQASLAGGSVGQDGCVPPRAEDCACSSVYGEFTAAIHRWELTLGRLAPVPVVPSSGKTKVRLSPRLSEFMMGLPENWLDVPGVSESAQLTMAGNAVVPAQAAEALRRLLGLAAAGDPGLSDLLPPAA